jgi:tetratricopeptide (TPR) repeat protein
MDFPTMMKTKTRLLPIGLLFAVATASLLPVRSAHAQAPAQKAPESTAPAVPETAAPPQESPAKAPIASPIQLGKAAEPAKEADSAATPADRAQAYYHLALASLNEEEAVTDGRPEFATRAIEEYKLALNADPASPELNNALADLYFRTGHSREAESTARELLKSAPDDIDAHKLLGHIYLRTLSEGQDTAGAAAPATSDVLDKAITEFEKIVALQPQSVEERMVLGQLYTVKHDQKKAEEQFKTAQAIEPESEDVVLNLARLYAESGDVVHEIKVLEGVAAGSRTAKVEDALGGAYEQLKQPKEAIAAYRRAAILEPDDLHTLDALAEALLNDNQLDEALKQYRQLADADPENAGALVHIGEIQRRQGKYEDALATILVALKKDPGDLEAGYNQGLLLDVLGRYDEAAQTYEKLVDQTSHANGAYTDDEKANRAIFLERLGAVYAEQNKIDQAVAGFQKMIDMGGDAAVSGYRGQVGAYSDAKMFDKAVQVSRKAIEANPKNPEMKLMLAERLGDVDKTDEGLALAKGLLNNSAEDRTVWLTLGQMCVRARRWKDADDAFNEADELTTNQDDRAFLLYLRGELADRQKHYEQAEQFFRQALDLEPESAGVLNYLGYMLADRGTKLPEALKMIRKAVDLEPVSGAYLDSLGWVYFKMGEYELAEENLRQAVDRDQTDATVHEHMGDLYEKTGRIRLAAAQWELSLAEFAKSAPTDVEPDEVAKVQKKLDAARVKLAREDHAIAQPKPE